MKGPCRPILSVGLDPLTPLSLGGGRSSRPDSLSLPLSWASPPGRPLSWSSPPDPLGLHPLDSVSLGPPPLTPSPPLPLGCEGLPPCPSWSSPLDSLSLGPHPLTPSPP